jgi:hypothetical protein
VWQLTHSMCPSLAERSSSPARPRHPQRQQEPASTEKQGRWPGPVQRRVRLLRRPTRFRRARATDAHPRSATDAHRRSPRHRRGTRGAPATDALLRSPSHLRGHAERERHPRVCAAHRRSQTGRGDTKHLTTDALPRSPRHRCLLRSGRARHHARTLAPSSCRT